MLLNLKGAATILGVPERTLRARLARGEIKARKQSGRWRIDRWDLPLDEAARRALTDKAEGMRATFEAALPDQVGARAGRFADSAVFRLDG